ncbi:MAG: DNA repair exonuclease [Pirellulaceae bacterium]|nr:DNA repair exonuclease [Pirellulaceae bacterium]
MIFVHTADWQIGMKAAHAGTAAGRIREARFDAARRVVELARQHQADFLVLAGDTFEDNAVDRKLVQRVADTLAAFAGPVYLLPGNHDPLVPGSVWEHPAWAACDRLHILAKAEPIDVPDGRLYPCPLFEKHGSSDPTIAIAAADDQRIAVGVAHGSVEGIPQDRPDFPIARDAAARAGLDYLALGHWHSTAAYDGRMAYSGTHETTKFNERDSGNALLVEIDRRGALPRLTTLRTGGLTWLSLDEPIRAEGDLARVRQEVESIADPEQTLLEIALHGVLHAADRDELSRIDEIAAARSLFHRIDASRLLPAPEDDRWLDDLPDGPIRAAARRLQALANSEATDGTPERASSEATSPEVAARALFDLYAIASGGRR